MLQDWENFMSPSGGNMENAFHFGGIGFFADFGSGLMNKFVHEPLRLAENEAIKDRMMSRARTITEKPVRAGKHISHPHRAKTQPNTFLREHHINPALQSRIRARQGLVNNKYARLKGGAKLIGWGYVALSAAQVMESLTTPGLTKSAEMNNAKTMGMAPPLDSSQAYTQRQRSLMAIHDSQLGIRNVIGSEAGYLHR